MDKREYLFICSYVLSHSRSCEKNIDFHCAFSSVSIFRHILLAVSLQELSTLIYFIPLLYFFFQICFSALSLAYIYEGDSPISTNIYFSALKPSWFQRYQFSSDFHRQRLFVSIFMFVSCTMKVIQFFDSAHFELASTSSSSSIRLIYCGEKIFISGLPNMDGIFLL